MGLPKRYERVPEPYLHRFNKLTGGSIYSASFVCRYVVSLTTYDASKRRISSELEFCLSVSPAVKPNGCMFKAMFCKKILHIFRQIHRECTEQFYDF